MNSGHRAPLAAPGRWIVLAALMLSACAPATPATSLTAQVVPVYGTAAAQPWLIKLYDCGATQSAVLSEVNDPQSAAVVLQLGQPRDPLIPAFQVGQETLEVWTNAQTPTPGLNAAQARQLFSGQIVNWKSVDGEDAPVNVWVYAADDDLQQVFETALMDSRPVTSLARLASSPREMAQAIANDHNAIGIMSGSLALAIAGGHSVFSSEPIPVLAITPSEPQGTVRDLLGCMQK